MQWRGVADGLGVPEEERQGAGIPEVETGQEEDTRVEAADTPVGDAREDNQEDRMALPDSRHRTSTRSCPEQTISHSLTSCLTTFPPSFRWTRRESMPLVFRKEGSWPFESDVLWRTAWQRSRR